MKNGLSIFFVTFITLGGSFCAFVLAPVLQLGTEKQTTILNSPDPYPIQRPGAATLGLQVYRANGCAQCHTEQIQQSGMACDVVLTSAGSNPAAVSNLVATLKLTSLTEQEAGAVSGQITAAGGKTETHVVATGADIARGWGVRRSVAADNLYDDPVQLGSLRVGPDLADVAARLPDLNWQMLHLYAPQGLVKNSGMPPFRYLFKTQKIGDVPSPEALIFPQGFAAAPPAGYEAVPTDDAKNLAAYLLSLRADEPLYEAPFTPVVSTSKK